jgi:hypothetical protein
MNERELWMSKSMDEDAWNRLRLHQSFDHWTRVLQVHPFEMKNQKFQDESPEFKFSVVCSLMKKCFVLYAIEHACSSECVIASKQEWIHFRNDGKRDHCFKKLKIDIHHSTIDD